MDHKKLTESLDSILKEDLHEDNKVLNDLSKEEIKDLIQGTDSSDEDSYLVLDSNILDKVYTFIKALSEVGFSIEYYDADRLDGNYKEPYDVVILNIEDYYLKGSVKIAKRTELDIKVKNSINQNNIEELAQVLADLAEIINELK